jgi:hypothetical protein
MVSKAANIKRVYTNPSKVSYEWCAVRLLVLCCLLCTKSVSEARPRIVPDFETFARLVRRRLANLVLSIAILMYHTGGEQTALAWLDDNNVTNASAARAVTRRRKHGISKSRTTVRGKARLSAHTHTHLPSAHKHNIISKVHNSVADTCLFSFYPQFSQAPNTADTNPNRHGRTLSQRHRACGVR